MELTKYIIESIDKEYYGTYNCTNKGQCSWHDFAKKVLK
ncbi:hypothetical protein B2H97_07045 [Paraclostridium bifermentans]|nr:hypothetical protein B2H97_07045 [Paraclostridium bifermentans]